MFIIDVVVDQDQSPLAIIDHSQQKNWLFLVYGSQPKKLALFGIWHSLFHMIVGHCWLMIPMTIEGIGSRCYRPLIQAAESSCFRTAGHEKSSLSLARRLQLLGRPGGQVRSRGEKLRGSLVEIPHLRRWHLDFCCLALIPIPKHYYSSVARSKCLPSLIYCQRVNHTQSLMLSALYLLWSIPMHLCIYINGHYHLIDHNPRSVMVMNTTRKKQIHPHMNHDSWTTSN